MSVARFVAVGAGRMGRSIATAFAYAGHRVAVVDLRPRTPAQWQTLQQEALAEVRASLNSLAELGAFPAAQVEAIHQASLRILGELGAARRRGLGLKRAGAHGARDHQSR
jgi:3-hydroxyacyl-CoA dehydrogenase